jgi:hypothetical protein
MVFLKPFPPRTYPKVKLTTGGAPARRRDFIVGRGAVTSMITSVDHVPRD